MTASYDEDRGRHGSRLGVAHPSHVYHISIRPLYIMRAPPMEIHDSFLAQHKRATMRTGTVMGAAVV